MNAPQSAPQNHHSQLREELANVRFIKISGPTGDWIVFHEPSKQFTLTRDHVVFLCDRFSGVGASGVVVVTVEPQTKKQDPKYFLEAWSDDGQAATILTEAARAATHA